MPAGVSQEVSDGIVFRYGVAVDREAIGDGSSTVGGRRGLRGGRMAMAGTVLITGGHAKSWWGVGRIEEYGVCRRGRIGG